MNYNEEMAELFDELGLEYKLVELKEEEKATPEAYAELERRTFLRTEENRNMMFLSGIYAKNGLPCQNNEKPLTKKYTNK